MSQKLYDFAEKLIFEQDEIFCHVFEERQETTFRVEPCVRAELLLIRLQTLHDTRNAKLIVIFGTIKSSFFNKK